MNLIEKTLELTRNKTKRVNLAFNPALFRMFNEESKKEGKKPAQKLDEIILKYLQERGRLR